MDDEIPGFQASLGRLLALFDAVPESVVDIKPRRDDWSVKEIACHLVDSASYNHQLQRLRAASGAESRFRLSRQRVDHGRSGTIAAISGARRYRHLDWHFDHLEKPLEEVDPERGNRPAAGRL
jgi:hypothetical protein